MTTNDSATYAAQAAGFRAEANRAFAASDRAFDAGNGALGARLIHQAREAMANAEAYERLAAGAR